MLLAKELEHGETIGILKRGTLLYGAAFVFWMLDQHFCYYVQPFGFHAIWHLLSGMGGYYWIQFACAHELVTSKKGVVVRQLSFGIPYCN